MSDDRRDGHDRSDDAEQVRAYLVHLRGGAPFLSGHDSRLLLRWMDEGVEVGLICRALDQAAEKRRIRRVKTPLSLRNAQTVVNKREPVPPAAKGALADVVQALASSDDPHEVQASVELAALSALEGEALVAAAVDVARRTIEELWAACDRAALRAEAEEELATLRDMLDEGSWERALEGVARDRLRQRHPLLSAKHIWDTVHG